MKNISTDTVTYAFIDDLILEMSYKADVDITVSQSLDNYIAYDELVRDVEKLKRLVVLGENLNITADAKKLCTVEDKKREHKIVAQAILVNSLFHKIAASVYFRMLKPVYPNQIFKNREKALEFLSSQ